MEVDANTFWEVTALAGGHPVPSEDPEVFRSVEDRLIEMGESEIRSFEDNLASQLFALDRAELAAMKVTGRPYSQSSDSFLYNRCAVVVAGRECFDEILANPQVFQRIIDSEGPSCERILYVAKRAFGRLTGREWDHVAPHDYETGSNVGEWS